MKSAAIASVLACPAFCVPVVSAAEEPIPEGTQVVLTQADIQSRNTAKPDESTWTKHEEVVATATLIPTPANELPLPVQVISRKEIEESRANHCRKLSAMWGTGIVPGAASLENTLKILEDS